MGGHSPHGGPWLELWSRQHLLSWQFSHHSARPPSPSPIIPLIPDIWESSLYPLLWAELCPPKRYIIQVLNFLVPVKLIRDIGRAGLLTCLTCASHSDAPSISSTSPSDFCVRVTLPCHRLGEEHLPRAPHLAAPPPPLAPSFLHFIVLLSSSFSHLFVFLFSVGAPPSPHPARVQAPPGPLYSRLCPQGIEDCLAHGRRPLNARRSTEYSNEETFLPELKLPKNIVSTRLFT